MNSSTRINYLHPAILAGTQTLVQKEGLTNFSLRKVAESMGIAPSTIYNHFDGNDALLCQAVQDYHQNFLNALNKIITYNFAFEEQINEYIRLHQAVLFDDNKICLCAAMMADFPNLSSCLKEVITKFLSDNEGWIEERLLASDKDHHNAKTKAKAFVASIQGIMISCRIDDSKQSFVELCSIAARIFD